MDFKKISYVLALRFGTNRVSLTEGDGIGIIYILPINTDNWWRVEINLHEKMYIDISYEDYDCQIGFISSEEALIRSIIGIVTENTK
jgi:hypothetical protein